MATTSHPRWYAETTQDKSVIKHARKTEGGDRYDERII
jgi:hypothetical protein